MGVKLILKGRLGTSYVTSQGCELVLVSRAFKRLKKSDISTFKKAIQNLNGTRISLMKRDLQVAIQINKIYARFGNKVGNIF